MRKGCKQMSSPEGSVCIKKGAESMDIGGHLVGHLRPEVDVGEPHAVDVLRNMRETSTRAPWQSDSTSSNINSMISRGRHINLREDGKY